MELIAPRGVKRLATAMLEIRNLTKRFARSTAVSDVSLTVKPFEVTGFLGPNGAGKTTTVRMLTGLLQPSSGHILLDGKDIQAQLIDYKKRLGYVPEEPYVYAHLSAWEYLQLIGRLRAIPQSSLEEKIGHFLQLLSLYPKRHALLSSYSKGMKQKVLICGALLHNPDVLILDEPLSGLDVTAVMVIRHLVTALAREGKMIVYCSHVLEVVEKVCDRVVILHKGCVVANDPVERLRDIMKLPSLEAIFSQLVVEEDTEQVARGLVAAMKE